MRQGPSWRSAHGLSVMPRLLLWPARGRLAGRALLGLGRVVGRAVSAGPHNLAVADHRSFGLGGSVGDGVRGGRLHAGCVVVGRLALLLLPAPAFALACSIASLRAASRPFGIASWRSSSRRCCGGFEGFAADGTTRLGRPRLDLAGRIGRAYRGHLALCVTFSGRWAAWIT